jgi:hypothetical protein
VVSPTEESLRSALSDYIPKVDGVSAAAAPTYEDLLLGSCLSPPPPQSPQSADQTLEFLTTCASTGGSAESWPIAAFGSFIYRSSTMQDCSKAKAVASFFYWSQADPTSAAIVKGYTRHTQVWGCGMWN